jgi:hypothetical protein
MSVDVVTKVTGTNESSKISIAVVTPIDGIDLVRDAVAVALERISNAVVDQQKLALGDPPPNGRTVTISSDGTVLTESDQAESIGDIPFDHDKEPAAAEEELASV